MSFKWQALDACHFCGSCFCGIKPLVPNKGQGPEICWSHYEMSKCRPGCDNQADQGCLPKPRQGSTEGKNAGQVDKVARR